jgi:hypothetical protein
MNRISLFLISLFFAASIQAAPPSAESVEALLVAMKAEETAAALFGQMESMSRTTLTNLLKDKPLNEKQKRIVADGGAKLMQLVMSEMAWENVRPIYLKVYQENFSQEEVDGITAFYNSPAGSALVSRLPVVMQALMQDMAPRMGAMTEKITAHTKQLAADLQAAKD